MTKARNNVIDYHAAVYHAAATTVNARVATVLVTSAPPIVHNILGTKPGMPSSLFKNGVARTSVVSTAPWSTVVRQGCNAPACTEPELMQR
jgi:hypothetical protein